LLLDVFVLPTGTRLFAVLTFGGMKRICWPSGKFRLPMPLIAFTPLLLLLLLLLLVMVDDDVAALSDGIAILIGCFKYGELMPTLVGTVIRTDVAVAGFFSANAAAVSRSLPPPEGRRIL